MVLIAQTFLHFEKVRLFLSCIPSVSWTTNSVRIDEISRQSIEKCPMEPLEKVRLVSYIDQTKSQPTGALILLHGTGDNGYKFYNSIKNLLGDKTKLPHIKLIFPTAPLTAYSPLGGTRISTWCNISGFSMAASENNEDINNVAPELVKIIEREVECGISLNRIAIAGFSRGGGMSYHIGYRYLKGLAGVGVLSSFLPTSSLVYKDLKVDGNTTPLFQRHGHEDNIVNVSLALKTFKNLENLGVQGSYKTYEKMGHEITKVEIQDLYEFINLVIPDDK